MNMTPEQLEEELRFNKLRRAANIAGLFSDLTASREDEIVKIEVGELHSLMSYLSDALLDECSELRVRRES